ncbi:2-hydroxyacid dehydrogenase [Alisedimentitalea sp. MJ-SS2]|uniref:2-hydroxyacid dehydrogenase n=1 Tax=Aliisedimentitalea sp. MJ-SS2 TaxID=3049795 RepID=UPI00290FFF5D|nr:2-hydroxyacid dehydrogenase [Alisedimentitalea sp. MJ-SS2]MDU8927074.1 2-hydroxyacid dehydrogenase [Alisedimentitalea sp. MJ-SS2]
MTNVLAIGHYADHDQDALRADLLARIVTTNAEIAALPETDRQQVTALAFMGHEPFGGTDMDLLPNLGLIANFGVGYDAIDVDAAGARGVKVTNTPDVLNDDVADLAVALLIAQGREMIPASNWVTSGNWGTKGNFRLARKISGGSAGIVGLGRIGRTIADRLTAFKMDIHYTSRREKETPGWTYHSNPVSLAKAVDYLIVALVGGPDTENQVSKTVLEALGPRGIVVNISRGSTVDEDALLDALENGTIAGAGLDVFQGEPQIDPRFLKLENVVLQPHQGSATVETRAAMGQLQRDNIHAFLAGRDLLTPVN